MSKKYGRTNSFIIESIIEMTGDMRSMKRKTIFWLKNNFPLIDSKNKAGKNVGLGVSSIPVGEGSRIHTMVYSLGSPGLVTAEKEIFMRSKSVGGKSGGLALFRKDCSVDSPEGGTDAEHGSSDSDTKVTREV